MMPSFSRVMPIIILLFQHEMASHRNAVFAMQFPLPFWKDKRRDLASRLKVRTHTLRRSTPFILRFWDVSKASSSLTFLSVVRQSTEIELCKIESFQSRAFQLCCERRLTPSAVSMSSGHHAAYVALPHTPPSALHGQPLV